MELGYRQHTPSAQTFRSNHSKQPLFRYIALEGQVFRAIKCLKREMGAITSCTEQESLADKMYSGIFRLGASILLQLTGITSLKMKSLCVSKRDASYPSAPKYNVSNPFCWLMKGRNTQVILQAFSSFSWVNTKYHQHISAFRSCFKSISEQTNGSSMEAKFQHCLVA